MQVTHPSLCNKKLGTFFLSSDQDKYSPCCFKYSLLLVLQDFSGICRIRTRLSLIVSLILVIPTCPRRKQLTINLYFVENSLIGFE